MKKVIIDLGESIPIERRFIEGILKDSTLSYVSDNEKVFLNPFKFQNYFGIELENGEIIHVPKNMIFEQKI